MMTGKGKKHRFSALAARKLDTVQVAHLRTRFELAENSFLAEKAVSLVNQVLEQYEAEAGIQRVAPGHLVVEHHGEKVALSLLESAWMDRLGQDLGLPAVKRQHEFLQYAALLEQDPGVTCQDLWRLLGQPDPGPGRAPRDYDFLPESPGEEEGLEVWPRRPGEPVTVPPEVKEKAVLSLVEDYGTKKGQAEAMFQAIAETRAWCSPLLSELAPGQAVWFTYGTRRSRKRDPRLLVPVVLTLVSPGEQGLSFAHRGEIKAFKLRQLERITTQAWRQDGVLTQLDLEWLLGLTQVAIRELLEAYQEKFGVILPTAGTILDMGRTLTHKKVVVELALSGLTTQQIAQRIYHTPEAVDAYLKVFEKLLILRYYRMPVPAIAKVLGNSPRLTQEHLELAKKHFPDEDALKVYLEDRGVNLGDIC